MVKKAPRLLFLVSALFALACGGSPSSPPRSADSKSTEIDLATPPNVEPGAEQIASGSHSGFGASQPTSDAIPIDAEDAVWGSPTAPVTLVTFSDFQCPFCGRAHPTVVQLERTYGPQKLRVVFKHNPLPFHPDAMPAALVAQAVQQIGGSDAFFRFADLAFQNQRALTDQNLQQWAAEVGVRNATQVAGNPQVRAKIDRDIALATNLGLSGTPSFMINGSQLVGAQPFEKFKELVDTELREATALRQKGVPQQEIYARRVHENYRALGEPSPNHARPNPPSAPPVPDTTVWNVPVGKSPVQGPTTALVTVVAFLDFQCPFCQRVQPTLDEVLKRYGKKVRLVFKHNPLAFHPRAMSAANFAMEARAEQGDKGFWAAAKLLFDRQSKLEDDDLLGYAAELKLNKARVKSALTANRYKSTIEADSDLASDIEATGTPAFFINGRALSGAQPLERFTALIDEELAKADALVKAGTKPALVYGVTIKDGKSGAPFVVKTTAAPTKQNPSRGATKAPVTIQMWSDFQCPFCKRVVPTIEAIEKQYGWRVRVVWRNLPLPFHQNARLAAQAAMEAYAQGGQKAFWKMHELLFAGQTTPDGLKRPALERYAASIGLDAKQFAAALDQGKHDALIAADEADAKAAGLTGTPAFIINGYYVSGAQPFRAFKRVIQRAVEDGKLGRKPAP